MPPVFWSGNLIRTEICFALPTISPCSDIFISTKCLLLAAFLEKERIGENVYALRQGFKLLIATFVLCHVTGFSWAQAGIAPNRVRPYTQAEQALIGRMALADIPTIKGYVKEVLGAQIPADYQTPNHIRNAASIDEAIKNVNSRFPQFVNKEGPEYLRAVAADPIGFRDMILESRAARRQFNFK